MVSRSCWWLEFEPGGDGDGKPTAGGGNEGLDAEHSLKSEVEAYGGLVRISHRFIGYPYRLK